MILEIEGLNLADKTKQQLVSALPGIRSIESFNSNAPIHSLTLHGSMHPYIERASGPLITIEPHGQTKAAAEAARDGGPIYVRNSDQLRIECWLVGKWSYNIRIIIVVASYIYEWTTSLLSFWVAIVGQKEKQIPTY